jgi:hypothetical protein
MHSGITVIGDRYRSSAEFPSDTFGGKVRVSFKEYAHFSAFFALAKVFVGKGSESHLAELGCFYAVLTGNAKCSILLDDEFLKVPGYISSVEWRVLDREVLDASQA